MTPCGPALNNRKQRRCLQGEPASATDVAQTAKQQAKCHGEAFLSIRCATWPHVAELIQARTRAFSSNDGGTVYFLAGAGFFLRVVPSTRDSFDRIWGLGMAFPLSYSWMTFGCSFTICAAKMHVRTLTIRLLAVVLAQAQ